MRGNPLLPPEMNVQISTQWTNKWFFDGAIQYTLCESPTLLLWVIRHKQLIERVDVVGAAPPHRSVVAVGGELQHHLVIPQWVRRLGLVDHERWEEEGLDEPDVALLLEVGSHLCPSKHVAQQLRFNLGWGKDRMKQAIHNIIIYKEIFDC